MPNKPTKENTKYRFINNIWIIGFYKDQRVVGRTAIIENEEVISIVNEDSKALIVKFSAIKQPNKLALSSIINKNEIIESDSKKLEIKFNNDLTGFLASQKIELN